MTSTQHHNATSGSMYTSTYDSITTSNQCFTESLDFWTSCYNTAPLLCTYDLTHLIPYVTVLTIMLHAIYLNQSIFILLSQRLRQKSQQL
jgi:hypothetical protein